jgi:hypothetical protein
VTVAIVLLGVVAGLLLVEGMAFWVYVKKAPVSRKRALEFLLYRRIKPYTAASQAASQAAVPRYAEHPFTGWSLNPDFRNVSGQLIHNRHGFRHDGDFDDLDANAIRIYCAGDSTTYCADAESTEETWPFLLKKHLARKQGTPVEVINGGVGGFNTFQSYARLSAYIDYLRPDIVIVYHAKNDLTPFYNSYAQGGRVFPDLSNCIRSLNFDRMSESITPLARWSYVGKLWAAWRLTSRNMNLSHAFGAMKPPDGASMLATKTDYAIIETMQRNMAGLCRSRGVSLVYMTQRVRDPMFTPYVDRVNDQIRSLEDWETNCLVLDLDREFPNNPELFLDKLHFTRQGCERAAEHIGEFIQSQGLIERIDKRVTSRSPKLSQGWRVRSSSP